MQIPARTFYVIASSQMAVIQVTTQILNGQLPVMYKTPDECLKAYCSQPLPMQTQYLPWCVQVAEFDDELDEAADVGMYRLDLPTTPQRPN